MFLIDFQSFLGYHVDIIWNKENSGKCNVLVRARLHAHVVHACMGMDSIIQCYSSDKFFRVGEDWVDWDG